jgi:hypothetical protein
LTADVERVPVKKAECPVRPGVMNRRGGLPRPDVPGARSSLAWLLLTLCIAAAGVDAQTTPTPVEQIRADPQASVNEILTVQGVVDRLVNREGASEPSFYLEDDYGHQILVIPLDTPPARGDRVTVTGIITLDPAGDPVLTMFDAAAAPDSTRGGPPAVAEPPVAEGGGQAPAPGGSVPSSSIFRSVLIAAGIILALAVLSGFVLARARRASSAPAPLVTGPFTGHKDVDFATSALWPPSDQSFEGRTMTFARPDPTARLLPARLEVIGGGDAGEEIRFVGVEGDTIAMMFGRSKGEGPSHVQLKQKTVSRTHAIIRHRHGEWLIENLSTTNPTVLNDEILGVKERLLTDGDRIEMGEVTFRFRSS